MSNRKRLKRWFVSFQSDRLRGKAERTEVKKALRKGVEPEPRYATGRYWED